MDAWTRLKTLVGKSTAGGDDAPRTFEQVRGEELNQISASRVLRRDGAQIPCDGNAMERAYQAGLVGLAFSGGGIRSATFNLGVLQALAEFRLLRIFDYLSTVSGGGYIGGWLQAWLHRGHGGSPMSVIDAEEQLANGGARRPVRYLREYGNYLTPHGGADTWTVALICVRNFFLNLLILVLALGLVLLVPRALRRAFLFAPTMLSPGTTIGISFLLLVFAMLWTIRSVQQLVQTDQPDSSGATDTSAWPTVALPLGAAWLLATLLPQVWRAGEIILTSGFDTGKPAFWLREGRPLAPWAWMVAIGVGLVALWLVGLLAHTLARAVSKDGSAQSSGPADQATDRPSIVAGSAWILAAAAAAGAIGGLLLFWMARLLAPSPNRYAETAALWGPGAIVLCFVLIGTLHLGLAGRGFSDEVREWWSRQQACLALACVVMTGAHALAVAAPGWVHSQAFHLNVGGFLGWLMTTGFGLFAAGREGSNRLTRTLFRPATAVAPLVFVVGLLILLSLGVDPLVKWLPGWHWWWAVPLALVLTLCLSWRIGINEFSMHALYRNRLVRCYLGASNAGRSPHPFTGFDPEDGRVALKDLTTDTAGFAGPYPLLNTTLNLAGSKALSLRTRKSASFVFTPRHWGFEMPPDGDAVLSAFRPTSDDFRLGTPVAISGAAANPNMGHYTSPALAFLMTVFNVRLGYWFGNPRRSYWERTGGPRWGLLYLLGELLGRTDEHAGYVNLSDGGHFENLGLYELVRRGCRFIVVCDAGADPKLQFSDLGNAIEKCRADFGTEIDIDVSPIGKGEEGISRWHCAVGTIRYEQDDPTKDGTLVYVKASLTGDEPADAKAYASQHPSFPHQTTADQWFDERQFESYRALGRHVMRKVLQASALATERKDRAERALAQPDQDEQDELDPEKLFAELRQAWHSPSTAGSGNFTRHAAEVNRIFDLLRTQENLRFLDEQIYPEWGCLLDGAAPKPPKLDLPLTPDELRGGFYVCNQMIQLMENVYLDLALESEWDHPDNRGWMNLFRHWTWSSMFRVTWAISASTYGARFQSFCQRRLDLDLGNVEVVTLKGADERALLTAVDESSLNFVERAIVRSFLARNGSPLPMVHVLSLAVPDPTNPASNLRNFTFGFALTDNGNILYFRIQDHLRRMGLARKGLRALLPSQQVRSPSERTRDADRKPAYTTPEASRRFRRLIESVRAEKPPEGPIRA